MKDANEYSALQCFSPLGNDLDISTADKSPKYYILLSFVIYLDNLTFSLPLLGHHNAFCLVFVKENLLDVFLLVLEDNLPGGEVPVEKLARLGGHYMTSLLVNYCVSNNGAKSRVGKPELQLASHEIPDTWRQKEEYFLFL